MIQGFGHFEIGVFRKTAAEQVAASTGRNIVLEDFE